MSTMTRPLPSRTAGNGAATPRQRPRLGRLGESANAPPRIVLNCVEGFGKTTTGAFAPNPAILMSRGESGYATLRKAGLVPDCDCVELAAWDDVLAQVDDLADPADPHGAVVLDALGGFERLCHEYVCRRDFGGNWGETGFSSFQRGPEVAVPEWLQLLQRLDKVRAVKGIPVLILSHSKVKSFKNPLGPDFDRYIADCHEKTWGVTHKWADAVLFGTYITVTQEDRKTKRTKGIGGTERIIHTERSDGFDAKNRYGMPPSLAVPNDPSAMWATVYGATQPQAAGKPPAPAADDIPD